MFCFGDGLGALTWLALHSTRLSRCLCSHLVICLSYFHHTCMPDPCLYVIVMDRIAGPFLASEKMLNIITNERSGLPVEYECHRPLTLLQGNEWSIEATGRLLARND